MLGSAPASSQLLAYVAGTHADTLATPGASSTALPMNSELSRIRTTARMKCTVEPAASTTTRWRAGCLQKARSSSPGATSSRDVMPTILTKPPAGIALKPYSVSPRCRDQIVGPKPTKNCVAFMP